MNRRLPTALALLAASLFSCFAQERASYFMILTDPQFGMYSGNNGFEHETANFEFAVAAVNRLKPGFVIVLGDLVNKAGDPKQVAEYLRIAGRIDPAVPVYHVAGNHDVENEPTPESLGAFRRAIGRDYYSFRAGPLYGIVLDSTLIHSPKNALKEYGEQDEWLRKELAAAKASGAKQVVIFQHHPYFLQEPSEPDRYENIPLERRKPLLELFRNHGVRYIFAGHYHQNGYARDGQIEMIVTAPVGRALGKDGSGIRLAMLKDGAIEHRYYDFGFLPDKLDELKK